jgi:hypothetical protein
MSHLAKRNRQTFTRRKPFPPAMERRTENYDPEYLDPAGQQLADLQPGIDS